MLTGFVVRIVPQGLEGTAQALGCRGVLGHGGAVRDGVAADFEVATVKLITLAAVKSCESDCLVIVSVETWAHS